MGATSRPWLTAGRERSTRGSITVPTPVATGGGVTVGAILTEVVAVGARARCPEDAAEQAAAIAEATSSAIAPPRTGLVSTVKAKA